MKPGKTLIISLIILLTATGITVIIFLTEPVAEREGATKETAMLVEVAQTQKGNYRPVFKVTGTVVPDQDIMLSSRVSGEIINLSPAFVPGGFVKKGQVLLQIDPADYEIALALRESELAQAKADLNIEMGRQNIARQDYQLLEDTIAGVNRTLVLREPQLKAVKSRVDAARAAVQQAELDLERTKIKAPFDAHILDRNANIGSMVSPGEELGRLTGIDHYWVVATVPLPQLKWLEFPDETHERGSEVKIRNRTAWQEDEFRTGYVKRLVGSLEDQTRLARVIITVPDPLNRMNNPVEGPELILGAFMEASVKASELRNVFRVSRNHIRKENTVWIMQGDSLQMREVDILLQDAEYSYIKEGLTENENIVMTNLSTVVEGARLRTDSDTVADVSSHSD